MDLLTAHRFTDVIAATRLATLLLDENAFDDAATLLGGDLLESDPRDTDTNRLAESIAASSETGALEHTCHHRLGESPSRPLLSLRTSDLTLHASDLARAVGAERTLDATRVAQVEEALDLRAAFLSSTRVIDPAPGDTPRGALRHTFGSLTPQAAAPDLRGFPAGPLPQPQWGGSPYSLRPASLRMSRVKAGGEGS